MASRPNASVENNFTKGLITEFTGLNFPENAAIDSDNTEYTLIGDVNRRLGMNYELNHAANIVDRTNKAVMTYKWNNVGGDGNTQFLVVQIGNTIMFYKASNATTAAPISTQLLVGQSQDISGFVATGGTFDATLECQFTDGNGYLFIFHPSCDPMYATYNSGVINMNSITVNIRDFAGIPEVGIDDNVRPSVLTTAHNYNLLNQGWTQANPWSATSSTSLFLNTGAHAFTVAAGIAGISGGQNVIAYASGNKGVVGYIVGTVTSYAGTTLTISASSATIFSGNTSGPYTSWSISPLNNGYIGTWFTAVANYPSNSDQWWRYKNASGVFDPATTQANVSIAGPAPKGHFLLRAFEQYRSALSAVAGVTDIVTTARPTNGTWFQGRVWYTGVNASKSASGTAPFTTWTENIYFSQIVYKTDDFGKCYQQNDPTNEDLFNPLPTDGGVIVIQGSGPIYKLFPISNGLLVFAGNGVYFITGSQGIGFAANDYTITQISNVRSISCNSFVNVQGLPYFWNEEGIYQVSPLQQGNGLEVNPITVGTILSFYNDIPLESKKHVKGDYHPIDYVIQWIYKDANSFSTTNLYSYNKILNYNTYNKAFYPYTINNDLASINSINYISGPGGSGSPSPTFKYFSSDPVVGTFNLSFAELYDTLYKDWTGINQKDYESHFTTGYKIHGQGYRKFQAPYIYIYSRTNGDPFAFRVQSIWDFSNTGNSGRWSTIQRFDVDEPDFTVVPKRIVLRGQGYSLQIKYRSVSGLPFDFIGWIAYETQNTGP